MQALYYAKFSSQYIIINDGKAPIRLANRIDLICLWKSVHLPSTQQGVIF